MNPPQPARVGWIGLGNMGLAMSTNLQRHIEAHGGRALRYTNRTLSRGASLESLGAVPCETVADVVREADVIFLSLSDDDVVRATTTEIAACENLHGKIVVDTTTVHPDTTREVSQSLRHVGVAFFAAPVFGATPVAQRGQLLVAIGGPEAAEEAVLPYLRGVIARAVIRVGSQAETATLLKTTGNFLTAAMAETVAEAHVLAEKAGLSNQVLDVMIKENYGSYVHSISDKLVNGVYAPPPGERPRSDLNLAIKDVKHGLDIAQKTNVKLSIGDLTYQHLLEAQKMQRPLDSSAVYGVVRQEAGLDFETDFIKKRDGIH